MHALLDEVEVILRDHARLSPGNGCVLAVSGGLDSMLLLDVFSRLRPRLRSPLVVAHFNHQLRGADADADQQWVQRAAAERQLPIEIGRAKVRDRKRAGESVEATARRLRHAFLARVARKHGCRLIATAHHEDDQIELFLLRLLRGAGGSGLGGMHGTDPSPADPDILLVRPFLHLRRERLAAAAAECGLVWREDASNQDFSYQRNRVRHELIPLLQRHYQPALASVVRRTQTLLEDQADAIEALAREWLSSTSRVSFRDLPTALQRDIIRIQGVQIGLPVTFDLIESLRLRPETPHQINPGLIVTRTDDGRLNSQRPRLSAPFQTAEAMIDLSEPSGRVGFGGMALSWRLAPSPPTTVKGRRSGVHRGSESLDADAVGPRLHLRHWRPGDRFQPLGLPRPAKLQDLFTNLKVPVAARRRRVIAASATGQIVWVQGLRLGEPAKVTAATRRVLILQWRPHP